MRTGLSETQDQDVIAPKVHHRERSQEHLYKNPIYKEIPVVPPVLHKLDLNRLNVQLCYPSVAISSSASLLLVFLMRINNLLNFVLRSHEDP
jgi:hypothetical protein